MMSDNLTDMSAIQLRRSQGSASLALQRIGVTFVIDWA